MVTSTLRAPDARESNSDLGRLVLRLTIGILVLVHGISKITGGIGFIGSTLEKAGLPAALAYGVYIGEVLGPILVIVGVWTRLGAALIIVNMLFAVYLVALPGIASLNKYGGYALEGEALYLFGALAIALLGAGRMSVGGRYGPMN